MLFKLLRFSISFLNRSPTCDVNECPLTVKPVKQVFGIIMERLHNLESFELWPVNNNNNNNNDDDDDDDDNGIHSSISTNSSY